MPPEGIYRVAYQGAETVSATWRPQHTDSAPVRVTLRARPNSFSSAYRTSASHALRLSDVARENLLGRALRRAPRRTGADGSTRSRQPPDASPAPPFPLRYNNNCAFPFAHDTRAVVGLPDRPKLAPSARTLGTARRPTHAHEPRNDSRHARLRRGRAAIASRPPPARLPHRYDRHRQDRTAPQHDARRPRGRRGLLLSRSARRRVPAYREPRAEGARQGRDLSRPVRCDPHLRLQSPCKRSRGRARDGRCEHCLGVQEHLGAELGATP